MNIEHELLTRTDDEVTCLVCDTEFDKTGALVDKPDPELPRPKPVSAKHTVD